MKTNLFFIHTPFQLFVAQQIINQERLTNCIQLYSYFGDNKHFLNIFDTMTVESMWIKRVYMENEDTCMYISPKNNLFSEIKKVRKNLAFINSVIKKYGINCLFFGDIHNGSQQTLAYYYSNRDKEIVFFEEGSNHYQNTKTHLDLQFFRKCFAQLVNIIFYIPFMGGSYAHLMYTSNVDYDTLPITKRYNLLPNNGNSFDILIKPEKVFSDKIQDLIKKDLDKLNTNSQVLFISEPVYEILNPYGKEEQFITIENYFKGFDKDTTIVIKFHPRETDDEKERIIRCFENDDLKFCVISSKVNIPIEYYLQAVDFKCIYSFWASTMLYNGILYKKTKVESLIKQYHQLCVKNGITNIAPLEEKMMNTIYH